MGRPNGFGVGVGNYLYAGFAVLRIVKQKIRIGFNFIQTRPDLVKIARSKNLLTREDERVLRDIKESTES